MELHRCIYSPTDNEIPAGSQPSAPLQGAQRRGWSGPLQVLASGRFEELMRGGSQQAVQAPSKSTRCPSGRSVWAPLAVSMNDR